MIRVPKTYQPASTNKATNEQAPAAAAAASTVLRSNDHHNHNNGPSGCGFSSLVVTAISNFQLVIPTTRCKRSCLAVAQAIGQKTTNCEGFRT
jgi:hypothetical protein